jgi:hypothetical protein
MTITQTPARAAANAPADSTDIGGTLVADPWRSSGMRELDPEAMRRFRAVERRFLEVTSERGFEEIRTPTIEPLHLYTTAGASRALVREQQPFRGARELRGARLPL